MKGMLPVIVIAAACIAGCMSSGLTIVEGSASGCRTTRRSDYFDCHFSLSQPRVLDEGGLMKVVATGRNVSRKSIVVEYRFVWYDADGVEIASPTSIWIQMPLGPNAQAQMQQIAPSPEARSYALSTRFAMGAGRP